MASTFGKWRERVPGDFRFSLKAPREITHDRRLEGAASPLEEFLARAAELEDRLGVLLFQLPPSLAFDADVAASFLDTLRELHARPVALEARHESWFRRSPEALLEERGVARVAADPPRAGPDGRPGADTGTLYFRLHGTPETSRSPYRGNGLRTWEDRVREAAARAGAVYSVFDNTAEGEGTADALELRQRLGGD